MASAAAIQRAMLPDPLPSDGDQGRFTLFADMRTAKEVGGDFYDAFLITPDRLAITVGDVSGKGVPRVVVHGGVPDRHADAAARRKRFRTGGQPSR